MARLDADAPCSLAGRAGPAGALSQTWPSCRSRERRAEVLGRELLRRRLGLDLVVGGRPANVNTGAFDGRQRTAVRSPARTGYVESVRAASEPRLLRSMRIPRCGRVERGRRAQVRRTVAVASRRSARPSRHPSTLGFGRRAKHASFQQSPRSRAAGPSAAPRPPRPPPTRAESSAAASPPPRQSPRRNSSRLPALSPEATSPASALAYCGSDATGGAASSSSDRGASTMGAARRRGGGGGTGTGGASSSSSETPGRTRPSRSRDPRRRTSRGCRPRRHSSPHPSARLPPPRGASGARGTRAAPAARRRPALALREASRQPPWR